MIRQLLRVVLLVIAVSFTPSLIHAQQDGPANTQPAPTTPRSFLPPSAKAPAALDQQPFGVAQMIWFWVLRKQAELQRALIAATREIKTSSTWSAAWLLALASFGYGVFHAAGPGHGKAVITSYVLADGRTVRRGVLLAFLASLIQGVSALVVVALLLLSFKATGLQMRAAELWLATVSSAFVAAVGAMMLYRQINVIWTGAGVDTKAHGRQLVDSEHAEHGEEDGVHCEHGVGAAHDHHCNQGKACNHGHAHLPSPVEFDANWSWRRALALAFSVGIRPCTGAILVLVFAISQGLAWAGVFATFAMALGTAITVSSLAAIAAGSRSLAERFAGESSVWAARVQTLAGVGGSALILILGVALFAASVFGPSPL
jgi:ABC-type nickel/cobalt efflux system permease component RcnA